MADMFDSGAWQLLGEIKSGVETLKDQNGAQQGQIEAIRAEQATTNLRLASLERSEANRRWIGKTTVGAAIGSLVAAVFAWVHK